MTNEELVLLIQKTGNQKHIEELYNQNHRMIDKIARKCAEQSGGSVEAEDLVQEAFLFLLRAVEMWDPKGGASFLTYLVKVLRYSMLRYIESQKPVHIPEGMVFSVRQYEKAVAAFMAEFGRNPTAWEIIRLLNINKKKLQQIKVAARALKPSKSITDPISADDGKDTPLGELIADPNADFAEMVEDGIDRERAAALLWEVVDTLEKNESACLKMKYQERLTYEQMAERLHISPVAACGISNRALRKLKTGRNLKYMKSIYLDIYGDAVGKSGLTYFRNNHTSSTEQVAFNLLDGQYMMYNNP